MMKVITVYIFLFACFGLYFFVEGQMKDAVYATVASAICLYTIKVNNK